MRKLPGIIVVLMLLLVGCGGKKTLADYDLSFDSIVVDTVVALNKNANSPKCIIHLNLKTIIGPNSEMINDSVLRGGVLPADYLSLTNEKIAPRTAVDSFIKRYITDYRTFYGKVYEEEPTEGTATLSYSVDTEIRIEKDGIVNYIAHITNKAGAEETVFTLVLNIDAETGQTIHLWNLYDAEELDELGKDLARQLAKDLSLSDTIALREQGYFVHTDFYAPENYLISDEGVTFIYVPGEITVREKGEVRITK
ncbi:MAG: DUF3298 domain-containing protein [Prevotella sp.]|nr:DUF3298 domain-containing protein [Prevotella sp.]